MNNLRYSSQKIFTTKKVLVKKTFITKKISITTNIYHKKYLSPKNIYHTKYLSPKNIHQKKTFITKKYLPPKNIYHKTIFITKKYLPPTKNIYHKKYLPHPDHKFVDASSISHNLTPVHHDLSFQINFYDKIKKERTGTSWAARLFSKTRRMKQPCWGHFCLAGSPLASPLNKRNSMVW